MKISNDTVLKIVNLSGVGRKTAFKLLNAISHDIVSDNDFIDFVQDNKSLLRSTLSQSDFVKAFDKAKEITEKSEKAGIGIINWFDPDFPVLLKNIMDAPLLLSYKGNYADINKKPSIAIIGTRSPTEYGYKAGVRLGEVFGEAGFNVVSGLAIGCDTAGHTGCLNKSGYTTAVLAHGLDSIYPKANKYLADKILDESGLLISEYVIGQKAQASYFVERDRIQAGLSQAIIVVETDIKGGTMHTVKFAENGKRIVSAFDHPAKYHHEDKTKGNQFLINAGRAKPLYAPESIERFKLSLLDLFKLVNKDFVETPDPQPEPVAVEEKLEIAPKNTLKTTSKKPSKTTRKNQPPKQYVIPF